MLVKLNKNYTLNEKLIKELIDKHREEVKRISDLEKLYKTGTKGALNRNIESHKPNNKITNHYASYISNTLVGYILGVPVVINSINEDAKNIVERFDNLSDIASHNVKMALNASIAGYAYELSYIDDKAREKVAVLDTKEVIYCVENNIEEKPLFAIRYFDDITLKEGEYFVEIYKPDYISYYKLDNKGLHKIEDDKINSFTDVPVSRLLNDTDELGDFEKVASLIEAYNIVQSDTANDFEYFTDAILALYGDLEEKYDPETGEAIEHDFKNNKVVKLSEGSRVEWIIKQINDVAVENYKNRLDKDIHKFSFCPDMSSETFGNTSGESLKWRISGLRYRGGIKIQYFKKLLERRYKLLFNSLSFKTLANGSEILENIENLFEFKFTENIPQNDTELISNVKNMEYIISAKTKAELLEGITNIDADEEIRRLQEERINEVGETNFDFNNLASDINKMLVEGKGDLNE